MGVARSIIECKNSSAEKEKVHYNSAHYSINGRY